MKENFVFGWVSSIVAQNFVAWATEKGEGTLQEAEQFRLATTKSHPNEDWFCIFLEAVIEE